MPAKRRSTLTSRKAGKKRAKRDFHEEICSDVEMVMCDNGGEFQAYLNRGQIKEDIFVVNADLEKNPNRDCMHILVQDLDNNNNMCMQSKVEENQVLCYSNDIEFDEAVRHLPEGSTVMNDITIVSYETAGKNPDVVVPTEKHVTEYSNIHNQDNQKIPEDVPEDDNRHNQDIQKIPEDVPENGNTLDQDIKNKSKNKRKCSAKFCNSESSSFYTFPCTFRNGEFDSKNSKRCAVWVQYSGNEDLLKVPSSDLHHKVFLCGGHFSDKQFYNGMRKRLLLDAMPDIDYNPGLSEHQMKVFPVLGKQDLVEELNPPNLCKLDKFQSKFLEEILSVEMRHCKVCKEKFMLKRGSKVKCIHGKKCTDYSGQNDMDPGIVPEELKGLSYIEEQLIAPVHALISVMKLKGHQFGYSGNIINYSQDVKSFAKELPHKIKDLNSVINVKTSGEFNKPKHFQVRAFKVRQALLWLKENNPFYHNIEICEGNLQLLPQDGNVYDEVMSFESDENAGDETEPERNNIGDDSEAEEFESVYETGVPLLKPVNEKEQLEHVLDWPKMGDKPINEFTTSGYIVQAFPCLFPWGKADLKSPRDKILTPLEYFKHLMRYEDGRFSKHGTFRFFALNSVMRWQAISDGSVFLSKNPEFENMTVSDLKKELENNPGLVKKIMFHGSNLRGTKSYWYARGQELLSFIEQNGLPTLFFTLSCADLHWPELFKLLAPEENFDEMTHHRKRQLVQENPLIVDQFFLERAELFISEVLTKKYNVQDIWFRIEYQHRGSPHLHGVLWLENAPSVLEYKNMDEDGKQAVVAYLNELVTAVHVNCTQPKALVHPCTKKLSDINNLERDLAELLNTVQRHTKCSEDYCIRYSKKTKRKQCRFKFPQAFQTEPKIEEDENGELQFIPARNDRFLNKYNPYIIQTWRANIDIAPVLSKQALVNYLAKYITKSEVRSSHLIDLMKTIINDTSEEKSAKHALQRLYIHSCSERDISAQETCHLLMGLKLFSSGGRKFVLINFKYHKEWVPVQKEGGRKETSIFEKYQKRDGIYVDKCLWYMAKTLNFYTGKPYTKKAIVQVLPKVRINKHLPEQNETYYRQQVLLFVPWCKEEDVKNKDTWQEVYEDNIDLIKSNSHQECDVFETAPDELDEEEIPLPSRFYGTDEWMAVSKMGPSRVVQEVALGHREVDLNYDWHSFSELYEKYGGIDAVRSFLARMKSCTEEGVENVADVADVLFNQEQSSVLNLLKAQLNFIKGSASNFHVKKKTLIQGKAGTGKSLIIAAMTSLIQQELGTGCYVCVGPTGLSSVNINGSTIHSQFRIRPGEFFPLKGAAAHELSEDMSKVQFVLVDEYSMIGCERLHQLDERLRQAKGCNEEFGGVFLYMFGDCCQLPPIGDSAAYNEKPRSLETMKGKVLYQNFDSAVILKQVQRQSDPVFKQVLENIALGNVTRDDYDLLKTRFTTSVSYLEREKFKNTTHLYPKNKLVDSYNYECLANLKDPTTGQFLPVVQVKGEHNCRKAEDATTNQAEGLPGTITLARGSNIMLKKNLWTKKGLVNGSIGKIVDILYEANSTPGMDMPAVLICTFENYKGPFLDDELKTVPIIPFTKTWNASDGTKCSRTNFPIALSYSCTIHKSQGLTLEMAYVDIGDSEGNGGLSYVGLSRVKSLKGLLLEPFSFNRFLKINSVKSIKMQKKWLEYLHSLSI